MKISHWMIAACFIAPLFACSSEEDSEDGSGGNAGTGAGGSVITGGTGGGGTGGATGGTSGGGTGGTSGGGTGGTSGGGTGGTSGGGTGGGTGDCGYTMNTPECDACFQAACASQCAAATAEPTTAEWLTCVQGCSDQACADGCDAQYPAAVPLMNAMFDCTDTQCTDECGGGGQCGYTMNTPECNTCFQAQCATECAAATAEPTSAEWLTCVQGCADQACQDACDAQYPAAVPLMNAMFDCVESSCATECGSGGCALTTGDATCDACFRTACEAECAAASNQEVFDYLDCAQACTDQACADQCAATYPSAEALLTALDNCMTAECATECGG